MIVRVPANDPTLATPPPALRRADGDSLRGLAAPVSPIASDARCYQALDLFAADPTLLALPVVDDHGTPVGLLNRFTFLQSLSGAERTATRPGGGRRPDERLAARRRRGHVD